MRGPWAHPRSRGENSNVGPGAPVAFGSSPLTRGKRQMLRIGPLRQGLIPAHAGKTLSAYSAGIFPMGSSPLTRGKRSGRDTHHTPLRLIPAHAGKTDKPTASSGDMEAHPRSRGENIGPSARRGVSSGSSPLTRGKRVRRRTNSGPGGLIPAHAGKTAVRRGGGHGVPAHPRSRGENDQVGMTPPGGAGSSPLTRGKRACRRQCRRR